jgi:hypothetical protein
VTDQIHRFKVGQTVEIIPSTMRWAAKGAYEIVSLVPVSANDPHYRVKSVIEKHERVVPQSDLIALSPEDAPDADELKSVFS